MSAFNATDAIFFGFRVVKRDPILVAVLALLVAATQLAGMQLVWEDQVAAAKAMEALFDAYAGADSDTIEAATAAAVGATWGSGPLLIFGAAQMIVTLVAQAALLRFLVRDERGGWLLGLQLGGDELRIGVVSIVIAVLLTLAALAALVAAGVVAGVLSVVSQALGGLALVLGMLAAMAALVFLAVRLCAALAASVGERKFIVLGSWRLTAGRTWGLLGAFVVLLFITLVAQLLVWAPSGLLAPAATAIIQGMTPTTALEDPARAFLSPGYVLVTAAAALLSVVMLSAWSGVGAYAYRTLGGQAGYPEARAPDDAGARRAKAA